MMVQHASMVAQVLLKLLSVHGPPLMEELPDAAESNLRRDSFNAAVASRPFSNASSNVSASVINSGSKGDVTMKPPSSADSRFSTNSPSLTVNFVAVVMVLLADLVIKAL